MRIVVFSAGLLNSSCIAVVDCRAEGADLTEASERVHGGALGSEPEAITGIPLNASGDQRVEQHLLSLTLASARPKSFHTFCTLVF